MLAKWLKDNDMIVNVMKRWYYALGSVSKCAALVGGIMFGGSVSGFVDAAQGGTFWVIIEIGEGDVMVAQMSSYGCVERLDVVQTRSEDSRILESILQDGLFHGSEDKSNV